jgi:hypothetical protein
MILLFLCGTANSATFVATVEGTATDQRSHKPLRSVSITLSNSAWSANTKTDVNGRYGFNVVPFGAYRLEACCSSGVEMPRMTRMVTVNQGTMTIDLALKTYISVEGGVEVPGWKPPFGIIDWYDARVMARRVTDGQYTTSLLSPWATFTLLLLEGDYRIEVNNPPNYIIKSMTFGSRDILKQTLRIENPSEDKIEVILIPR